MPDNTARGRFVWHELMVPDTAKAHEFYSRVVGWKTQAFEHDPGYQMFAAGSGPLGGSVSQAEGAPHWLPFLGTNDIEATVREARGLGATVVTDVTAIPNGGRWARLTDPQGADFAVYQSTQKPGRQKQPKRGEFSWHELLTTDYQAAFEFYSKLFGWEKTDEVNMDDLGVYFMFGRNGMPLGGMYNITPQIPGSPAWTGYIRVKDVHKAVKKAKSGGATLINGPMEVPGGDWIAVFLDPQGAVFAVHTQKDDLAPPAADAGAAKPEQGTLDFPPVEAMAPERVDVLAKKPATKVARKPAKSAKKTAKPVAKKAAKKVAAKKAPAKKAAKKVAKKKGGVKNPNRKRAKKPAGRPKRAQKSARKAPAKKAKKQARRAK